MACVDAVEWDALEVHPKALRSAHGRRISRVLLADDQEEIRRTVASLLKDEFEIVGIAENGKQVLDLVVGRSPDVLVLDIVMPVLNGIETAACLKASGCPAKVIFVSIYEDPDFVDSAISAGALGYVSKAHLATDLIPGIHSVLDNHIYISPSLLSAQGSLFFA
jgi:DNA-binding NarL/FixJ family response regulator